MATQRRDDEPGADARRHEHGQWRRRAARSTGRRTTLRVPADLQIAVDRVAARDGITENAALIALATLGAAVDAHDQLRRDRRAAALAALDAHDERDVPVGELPADVDPEVVGEQFAALVEEANAG